MTKTSVALATAIITLCAACTNPNNNCTATQRFDPTLHACVGQCGTPEAPAHPRCYDQDSGTFVPSPGFDSGTDAADAVADVATSMDAADANGDAGGIDAPRPVFPMSLVVLSGQQPTFKWALASGSDGAAIELCRDRAMTADCQRWNATGSESRAPSPLARGMWFWRLTGRSGSRDGSAKSVTWSFWSSGRASARDATYAQIPDINGDGLADVVFVDNDTRDPMAVDGGIPDGGMWNPPKLVVHYGQRGGVTAMPTVIEPTGAWPFSLGWGFVADVDGDGFGDVISPAFPTGNLAFERTRIIVLRGSATGLSATPQWIDSPDVQFSGFGLLQFPIGDTDGDGRIEVALCSPGDPRDGAPRIRGRCHIFQGAPAGLESNPRGTILAPTFATVPTFLFFLTPPTSSQGDVNGDGRADMLLASDERVENAADRVEGRSFLYLSTTTGLPPEPTQTLIAPTREMGWGWDTSLLGDQNGDGALDLLVSRFGLTGTAYYFTGSSTGITLPAASTQTATASQSNYSLRAVGDVTGDGVSDASASWIESSGGQTVVVSAIARGTTSGIDAAFVEFSRVTVARIALSSPLAATGDVDGDGLFDVFDPHDHRICFGHASAIPNRCVAVAPAANTNRSLLRPMF